ncbi:ankyrin repeat domain-containing protein SOWAHC-like [Rhinoraja longicauda]
MAACGSGQQLQEEALVDFLAKNGGRVQDKELVERFKTFINAPEPQLKAKYRDIFKDIVNRIAVVKHEDGEKYIVLKKKYRHLVHDKDSSSSKVKNTSVQATFEKMLENDQPVCFGKEKQTSSLSDVHQFKQMSQNEASEISTPSKVNLCEWITQNLPTSDTISKVPLEITNDNQGNPRIGYNEASEEKQDERFESKNNATNSVNIEIKVEEAQEEEFDSVIKEDLEQNVFEDGSGSMGSPSVALDPLEKEWLKCAAIGHLTALCDLLRQDPSLAIKKDFTSTALHWAAKHGKENMARMLINAGVDINLRAVSSFLNSLYCRRRSKIS